MTSTNSAVCEQLPSHRSTAMIQAFKQYGQKSPFTKIKAHTDEDAADMMEDLLAWEAPEYIQTEFPYYFAGYSYDNHPVWVIKSGQFDMVHLTSEDPAMIEAAEVSFEQALMRVLKTMSDVQVGDELPRAEIILDMEGMSMKKLCSPKAMAFVFKMATKYKDAGLFGLEHGILINANYVVQMIVKALRPILGRLLERVELYGSNKQDWMTRLLQILPSSSLSESYEHDLSIKLE